MKELALAASSLVASNAEMSKVIGPLVTNEPEAKFVDREILSHFPSLNVLSDSVHAQKRRAMWTALRVLLVAARNGGLVNQYVLRSQYAEPRVGGGPAKKALVYLEALDLVSSLPKDLNEKGAERRNRRLTFMGVLALLPFRPLQRPIMIRRLFEVCIPPKGADASWVFSQNALPPWVSELTTIDHTRHVRGEEKRPPTRAPLIEILRRLSAQGIVLENLTEEKIAEIIREQRAGAAGAELRKQLAVLARVLASARFRVSLLLKDDRELGRLLSNPDRRGEYVEEANRILYEHWLQSYDMEWGMSNPPTEEYDDFRNLWFDQLKLHGTTFSEESIRSISNKFERAHTTEKIRTLVYNTIDQIAMQLIPDVPQRREANDEAKIPRRE